LAKLAKGTRAGVLSPPLQEERMVPAPIVLTAPTTAALLKKSLLFTEFLLIMLVCYFVEMKIFIKI
jgi:hypothetical protein